MALATDSRTLHLLRAFARRRRRLILLRGFAAALLALLVGMGLVALLDRFIVMETPVRLALSLAAYGLVVAVAWFTAARWLVRRDRPAELARMLETADPNLRDCLLAAVELGEHANGAAAFRRMVREDASRRASRVRVEQTLPSRLVAWWMGVAAGALVLCLVLLAIPQLQFGRMLSRALLPTAEIPRASHLGVRLEHESGRTVPAGEPVRFQVSVTGGTPRQVWLEIEPVSGEGPGERRRVPMRAATGSSAEASQPLRFHADISLDSPARLRAWADQADSPWLSVTAAPRPAIIEYTRRYDPPAYLVGHMEPTAPRTSEDGALQALESSTVELVLRASEAVSRAHIELLSSEGSPIAGLAPIPLAIDNEDPTILRGSFVIGFTGAYRIRLIAAGTGFDSPDARAWPITAVPDLPPAVEALATDARAVAAEALVPVEALARDDIGLAWLRRDVRINGGEWRSGRLLEPEGAPRRIDLREPLDLLPLSLLPGDRVEARLLASDLKGAQAVVRLGEWVIATDTLGQSQLSALAARSSLAESAARLAQLTGALHIESSLAPTRLAEMEEAGAGDSLQLDQLRLSLAAQARSAQLAAEDLLRTALIALGDVDGGRGAADVERLGLLASALRLGPLEACHESIGSAGLELETHLPRIQALALEAATAAEAGLRLAEAMLHSEQAALAVREVVALQHQVREQEALLERGLARDPALAWQQYGRSSAALAARVQAVRQRLDAARPAMIGHREGLERLDQVRIDLDRAGERLRRAQPGGGEALRPAVAELERLLQKSLLPLIRSATDVELQAQAARTDFPAASLGNGLSPLPPDAEAAPAWGTSLQRLGHAALLQERRPDLDRQWLADLSLAMQAVRGAQQQEGSTPAAKAIEDAVALLEAGHEVAALRMRLEQMIALQQLEPEPLALEVSRDWIEFDGAAASAAQSLRLARQDARQLELAAALASTGAVDQVLAGAGITASSDQLSPLLQNVARQIEQVEARLSPALQEARAVLAAWAVPLAQQMRELAGEAEHLAEVTPLSDPADAIAQQQALAERMLELDQAITRDAAQQDLLTRAGRERARDADDARAMLQRDLSQALERLQQAQMEEASQQPSRLQAAAEAQQRSADTLRQLVEHYENLASAPESAEQSRQALRAEEDSLGIRQRLDEEYGRLARLSEMREMDQREMLETLEHELAENQAMQRELARLGEAALDEGRQRLQNAIERERQAEANLSEAEQSSRRLEQISRHRMKELAEEARRLAGEQVPKLSQRLEDEGAGDPELLEALERGQEALREAAEAAEQDDVQKAIASLEEARHAAATVEVAQHAEWERSQEKFIETALEANRREQAGEDVRELRARSEEAGKEAERAGNREAQARKLMSEARSLAHRAAIQQQAMQEARDIQKGALQRAEAAQADVNQQAGAAADELERAARHEQRLGNEPRAEAIQQAAQGTQQAQESEIPAAAEASRSSSTPSGAAPALAEARQQLENQSANAERAAAMPAMRPAPAAEDRSASMLAQALDQADRAVNSPTPPGTAAQPPAGESGPPMDATAGNSPGSQSGQGQMAQLAQQAAEAQARTMRQRRTPTNPGQPVGEPPAAMADLSGMAEQPDRGARPPADGGDWGRLPPQVVRDLLQGQRDVAPAEYRDLVEAYYRAIAERSREGR